MAPDRGNRHRRSGRVRRACRPRCTRQRPGAAYRLHWRASRRRRAGIRTTALPVAARRTRACCTSTPRANAANRLIVHSFANIGRWCHADGSIDQRGSASRRSQTLARPLLIRMFPAFPPARVVLSPRPTCIRMQFSEAHSGMQARIRACRNPACPCDSSCLALLAVAALVLLGLAISLVNSLLEFYERVAHLPLLIRVPLILVAAAALCGLLGLAWKLLRPARGKPARGALVEPARTAKRCRARVAELRLHDAGAASLEQELIELDRRRRSWRLPCRALRRNQHGQVEPDQRTGQRIGARYRCRWRHDALGPPLQRHLAGRSRTRDHRHARNRRGRRRPARPAGSR